MKKMMILFLSLVIITGCGRKKINYEQVIKDYATNYFKLHMSGATFKNDPKIKISDLKKGVEKMNDQFDLSKLENCDNESYVILKLNKDTNEILDYEFNISCK